MNRLEINKPLHTLDSTRVALHHSGEVNTRTSRKPNWGTFIIFLKGSTVSHYPNTRKDAISMQRERGSGWLKNVKKAFHCAKRPHTQPGKEYIYSHPFGFYLLPSKPIKLLSWIIHLSLFVSNLCSASPRLCSFYKARSEGERGAVRSLGAQGAGGQRPYR